jgi:putative chitinase
MNFQKSDGLISDGIAGSITLYALELQFTDEFPDTASIVTVSIVSKILPSAPKWSIKKYLPYILQALKDEGLSDKKIILTALATVCAETESFAPISEFISQYNTSPNGKPIDL